MKSSFKLGDSVLFIARKAGGPRFEARGKVVEIVSVSFKGGLQKRAKVEVVRGGKYHKLMGKRITTVALHNLRIV